MDKLKFIRLLKIIFIVSLLILTFILVKYPTHPCKYCSFDVGGKEVGIKKFMEFYYDECFVEYDVDDLELNVGGTS